MLLLGVAPSCADGRLRVVRRSAPHMGTVVTITVAAESEAAGERSIDAGFAEVARLDRLLSSYRADSDLSRLNAQAGAGPVAVSAELLDVTAEAIGIAEESGGAFNPLIGPVVRLWGIPDRPRRPTPDELARLRPLLDLGGLSVDPRAGTIALAMPDMAVDVGGIGKGYAADRVAALLRARGISGGVVGMSGDVRAFGSRPGGQPWRVAVRDPRGGPDPLGVVELTDGAMSTSGTYERFFEIDGVRYHHILDPRTLMPATSADGLISVSVMAASATRADGLATAVLVMGGSEGMALVERSPGVEALVLDVQGRVRASAGWPARKLDNTLQGGP